MTKDVTILSATQVDASIAGGTPEEAARAAERATTAFYTGEDAS